MTDKIVRPKLFYHGPYAWVIKYFNVVSDDHGKTHYDAKEIHIFTKDRDEATVRDTLLHEISHVVNADLFTTIQMMFKEDTEASDVEEQYILLSTPRWMSVFNNNHDLLKYLFDFKKEIK